MKSNFSLRQYRLHFKSSVRFFDSFISEKRGTLALSENFPPADFPFMDISELEKFRDILNHFAVQKPRSAVEVENLFSQIEKFDLPASVSFGIQSIVLNAFAVQRPDFFAGRTVSSYPFFNDYKLLANCSVSISPKVKFSPEDDCINSIIDFFRKTGMPVRLDFNRKFTCTEAFGFLKLLPPEAVLYVEEPCNDVLQFPALQDASGISYALDETLINRQFDCGDVFAQCRYFVLKPSLFCGISLVPRLLQGGKSVIFSSDYETPAGIESLKKMIIYYGLSAQYHGLDTQKLITKFEWQ